MLLRFFVSNFRSFSEEVEFNMFPGDFKIHKEHIYNGSQQNIALLKGAALYGANGSGKSNFIKAVHFLLDLVTEEDLSKNEVPCVPFRLDDEYAHKPSEFGLECKIDKNYYEYSVVILEGAIIEENLYQTFPGKEAEMIFSRTRKNDRTEIKVHAKLTKTQKDQYRFEIYQEDIKDTQSLIFKVRDVIEEAKVVYNWFKENLWIVYPKSRYLLAARLCTDGSFKQFLNDLLPKLGTGMAAVEIQKIPFSDFFGVDDEDEKNKFEQMLKSGEKKMVIFKKNRKDYIARKNGHSYEVSQLKTFNPNKGGQLVEFEPTEQSDGTQRIMDLIPAIHQVSNHPSVFLIDEIDRSLHPTMVKELLRYYMAHPSKGQLIFTTHETSLLDLDIFRQDEIWLTEKDHQGATKMYPLSDFKPRYDLNIRKGYLAGRFGAIPFIGNLNELNWYHAEKQSV